MKRIFALSPLKISLAVALMVMVLFLLDVRFLKYMELKAYDLRMIARGDKTIGGEVLVVAIDEKSLNELGRWPWSRQVMARLIKSLKEKGARVIGFDVVFAEQEEGKGMAALEELSSALKREGVEDKKVWKIIEERRKSHRADEVFSAAIKEAGKVILGYFFHFSSREVVHLNEEEIAVAARSIGHGRYELVKYKNPPGKGMIYEALAAMANLEVLSRQADGSGYFNVFPDGDGTIRWAPLVIKFRDNYYCPLSLSLLMSYLDWPEVTLQLDSFGVAAVHLGEIKIPVDKTGRLLVNYRGGIGSVPHVSATDAIHNRLPSGLFKDKIVIIGATAIGLYDLRVTPFSPVSPGVNIHATVIDNILRGDFIVRSFTTSLIDVLLVIFLPLFIGLIIPRFKAVGAALFAVGTMVAFVVINYILFSLFNLWMNLVYPLGALLLAYVGITVYTFFTEEKEKRKIRHAFQHYLASSVVNEILKDTSKLKLGGEKRELTVLFSDIRGFTSISEVLTPEELVTLLNEYLTVMTEIVFKYDGLLDKYIGDAIMAVFGAPVHQPDHHLRACKVALEMEEALGVLQRKWTEEGRPVLKIGVGINSGEMVVGNMGSQMRFDYTVMGDSVNLASRLEGLNKLYGTSIIISEYTYNQVRESLVARELDLVRVKGKARPARIYELRGEKGRLAEKELGFIKAFEAGLVSYRQGRWEEARASFVAALALVPEDKPSLLYLARLDKMAGTPPLSWDGIFNLEEK